MACTNIEERGMKERQGRRAKKRKVTDTQRVKPPTPSQAINAVIRDKEQDGKQKKETGSETPTTATLDLSDVSYGQRGLYVELIPLTSPPHTPTHKKTRKCIYLFIY